LIHRAAGVRVMKLTRDDAVAINLELRAISGKLDGSISELMRSGCSGLQFTEYRKLVGRILGNLYFHILRQLFDEFPDLKPAQPDRPERPLNAEVAEHILQLMTEMTSMMDALRPTLRDRLGEEVDEGFEEIRQAVSEVRTLVHRSQLE
jgi:hypothetical protein